MPKPPSFLARLFSKKRRSKCHSPGVVVGDVVIGVRRPAKTLTFANISVIIEGIDLKRRVVVHYHKGNSYQ